MNQVSPRVMSIEGQATLVVERTPPLPRRLDHLLGALFRISVRNDIVPRGASTACEVWRTHDFAVLREGQHLGLDGVVRDLRIEMCTHCGAACVRDISIDIAFAGERVPIGRGGPQRRDHILGWYSGARRANRQHL